MWNRYTDWVLARPWLFATACILLTLACGSGLSRLKFSTDYREYFSADNPDLAALEKLEKNFGRNETVLFVVVPKDGNIFTPDTLQAMRELTGQWARVPYARGSISVTNYYDARSDGDSITAAPMLPEGPLKDIDLEAVRQRAINEPRLVHGLISPKGDVAGVVFYFEMPHQKPAEENTAVARAVLALADEAEQRHPNLEVRLSGVILLNEAMSTAIKHDNRSLNPFAYGLMFVLLALFFRGFSAAAGTLIVAIMGIVTALGIAGWMGITLAAASLASTIIILTLSIADCVHLLSTTAIEHARGADIRTAVRASLRGNSHAIFLTTLTTAVGALGLNSCDSPPYRDLGNIVAIGVTASWLYTAGFLPAWAISFPPRRAPLGSENATGLRWLAEFVIRHRNALLSGSAAFTLAMALALPLNEFGDNYVEFFDESLPFRADTEFINRHLTGVQFIDYGVYAQEADGVYEPAFLQHVDDFTAWLRAQPEVVKASSVADLIKRLNETMHGGDAAYYKLPGTRELAAQYLLFYEMSLPSGSDISHLVNLEKSGAHLSVQLTEMSSDQLRAFDERARDWMERHWPQEMQTRGSGIAVMFANIAWRNFASMASGTAISALLIAVLLYWAFGSLRLCLVSLIPNVLPALYGFGLWGLFVGKVDMSLAVVLSMTIGIVVDDTIHFLSHYGRARQAGDTPADALRHAFASIGPVLWLLSVVLVGGFVMLTLSDFKITAHLGALTSVVIGVSVLADFLMLAPLLLWLDRDRR